MQASAEASHELYAATQRLVVAREQATSRVPKRRWIGQKNVEEAEMSVQDAKHFYQTVEKVEAFAQMIDEELVANEHYKRRRGSSRKRTEMAATLKPAMTQNYSQGWRVRLFGAE